MQQAKDSSTRLAGGAWSHSGRYLAVGIVLLALVLRVARLAFQPLWWDEGWSLYFATTDVGTMLRLTAVDIHPPLYYLLLHGWLGVLGVNPIAARLLSVAIGTGTIPLLYLTGKRLWGARAGLLAAFLLAISPFHIYYSQEVRMYGLVTLLGLAAFYFALRWASGDRGIGIWLGYVLAAAAALYTQYYAAFLLLALNLAVLILPPLTPRGRGRVLGWLGAQVAVVLLYTPWLWYAGGKLLTYVRFKVSVEKDVPLGLFTYLGRHLAAFNWGHAEGALTGWWWAGLLPPVLLVASLVLCWRKRIGESGNRGIGDWPLVVLVVVLACGFGLNLAFPFSPQRGERLLLLSLPAYLLLVAGILLAWRRRNRPLALLPLASLVVLGVLSLSFFYTVPRYPDDDYRPVAERLRALALPTDAVICIHPWQVGYLAAYLPQTNRPTLLLTPRQVLPRERQLWADDPTLMAADLETLLTGHSRVWLPAHQAMGQILENQIEGYLAEHTYPVISEWYGPHTVLSLFATGQPASQSAAAHFGDWLSLKSAALTPGPHESGWGVVAVDLTWQTSEQPKEDYTVGLRLIGPTGYVWAQRDAPPNGGLSEFAAMPVGEATHDHHGLLVPAGTPPGEYRLVLQVYRRRDVAVLPATFAGGSGGEVTLGTVKVVRPTTPPRGEALNIARPWRATAGPLELLGFDLEDKASLRPGEALSVVLFWRTLAAPGEDLLPRLQLLDGNRVVAELTEKPVMGTYPTAWWQAGDLVRDPHLLPIPATVAAGHYQLALSLIRAGDGQAVLFGQKQPTVDLGEIEVKGREHIYTSPTPQYLQAAHFGPDIELIGYDLPSLIPNPHSPISLTLHWHALATPDKNYHAFVHLLDGEGHIIAQHDGPPGEGQFPTLGWLPGEYVTDEHRLQISSGLPPGEYRLAVGLYDPLTGARLGAPLILDTPLAVRNKE